MRKRQAPCRGRRRNFSFLFAHNCFLSPYFKRHQLWDLSQKSGRKQFSQASGKEAKDPKQHFLTHLPPTPPGSFVASFWSQKSHAAAPLCSTVWRIPFRDSGSCTGYVWMGGVTVSPQTTLWSPRYRKSGAGSLCLTKGSWISVCGFQQLSVHQPILLCEPPHEDQKVRLALQFLESWKFSAHSIISTQEDLSFHPKKHLLLPRQNVEVLWQTPDTYGLVLILKLKTSEKQRVESAWFLPSSTL